MSFTFQHFIALNLAFKFQEFLWNLDAW
jgi:hypothetical protein